MFLELFPENGKYRGWIEVICGSMFSGKTEELIRRLKRVRFAEIELLLFQPVIDTRYDAEKIVSHNGSSFEAVQVNHSTDILEIWNNERVVAIDESQFFDNDLIEVARVLASKGVRVICAGLDMDFLGQPYGPMPSLMATAEYVTKVHAICVSCGNLAQFSHRKSKEKEQLLLGAMGEYEPLCRVCYNKLQH
ncbi:MAG: thymidine kinase [Brumimicrobium sp.]